MMKANIVIARNNFEDSRRIDSKDILRYLHIGFESLFRLEEAVIQKVSKVKHDVRMIETHRRFEGPLQQPVSSSFVNPLMTTSNMSV